jgi:hypothetical protein
MSDKYVCEYCGKECNSKQAKYIHKRVCKYKREILSIKEKTLLETIKEQKKQLERKETQLDNLAVATKESAEASKESAKTAGKSMNMMKYAMINFKDAPPLLELTEKQTCELLEYEGATDTKTEREANEIYVRTMLNKYEDKVLDKFFGKMVVSYEKVSNPKDRKVWSTDTSRLSFIVMEQVNKRGDKEWKNDKSGKRFASLIIEPVLRKAGHMLGDFVVNQRDLTDQSSPHFIPILTDGKRKQIMDESHTALLIQKQIKGELFEKKVLQYSAPYFNFNYFRNVDGKFEELDYSDIESNSETRKDKVPKKVIRVMKSEKPKELSESSDNSVVYNNYGLNAPPVDFRDTMKNDRLKKEQEKQSSEKITKIIKKSKK